MLITRPVAQKNRMYGDVVRYGDVMRYGDVVRYGNVVRYGDYSSDDIGPIVGGEVAAATDKSSFLAHPIIVGTVTGILIVIFSRFLDSFGKPKVGAST